jgi:tetratricopeptide (TPR) repeat protein
MAGFAQELQFENLDLRTSMLQVADHYARDNDWQKAVLQYYEFLFRFPDDSLTPGVYIRIASVYQQCGEMQLAEEYYRKAVDQYAHTRFDLENRLRLAVFYYDKGDYEAALQYALAQREPPFRIIIFYTLIRLREVELADSIGHDLGAESVSLEIMPEYLRIRAEERVLGWKKKWGIYACAALLPGSGQILNGDYRQGGLIAVGFLGLLKATTYAWKHYPGFYYYLVSGVLISYGVNLYATYDLIKNYEERASQDELIALTEKYSLAEQLRLPLPY